jgi:thiamine transport system substrate-binding protein
MKNILSLCVLALIALPAVAATKPILTVYTYDSFASEWGPGPAIEKSFEEICACDLQFIALDSSIGILGRVQLEGVSSKADIVLGLDTNLMATAAKTGLFASHGTSLSGRTALPISFEDNVFVPFDWGYFAFVYDSTKLNNVPTSFDALVNAPDDLRIIIQDPRTATPGLGLLLWMKSVYGEEADQAWSKLAPKIVTVTKGWWDSYSMFLEGEADMVLSYSTSPAYHIVVDGTDKYKAAAFSEGHYMQVEVAAMLQSAPQPALAREFMNFILEDGFQSVIPTTNWMYPAGKAAIPEVFSTLIRPLKSLNFSPEKVAANKSAWVAEWQSAIAK